MKSSLNLNFVCSVIGRKKLSYASRVMMKSVLVSVHGF